MKKKIFGMCFICVLLAMFSGCSKGTLSVNAYNKAVNLDDFSYQIIDSKVVELSDVDELIFFPPDFNIDDYEKIDSVYLTVNILIHNLSNETQTLYVNTLTINSDDSISLDHSIIGFREPQYPSNSHDFAKMDFTGDQTISVDLLYILPRKLFDSKLYIVANPQGMTLEDKRALNEVLFMDLKMNK